MKTQRIQTTLAAAALFFLGTFLVIQPAFAKKTEVRKVQEVNFSEMNLKGTIRNPDGAYLVQKKGLKFMPLHDVQKDMDAKIRETSLYID
ncbi:MAG: hypothetical protein A2622_01350 [Bdellovibrionales bacterium RIFCSPHIGHO2_01_FULL_40_29]|nr:MAG: hypothetical protein A2622_01350 [Bdellovibrionales bacterium RIFCSPHIGHO2_01_FULL_40_29]OFZ32753.1 MAG: hypothetical protein A3D17_05950 [Bdellovibrionales bacterium RIFCSPHIGHO2_02_FULL_40_15]